MANGLPIEGEEAHTQRAADLARQDVPTCGLSERIGEVKERVQEASWDSCVVVFGDRVILGQLRREALEADPQFTAEQVMVNDTRTYRLDAKLEKTAQYMQKHDVDGVLVTTSDGKLFGLLKRDDVEKAISGRQETK